MIFEGNCTALVTPFLNNGSVNYKVLQKLIEEQIESKSKALLVLGTTGESATLTLDEKIEIVKLAKKLTKDKIPLIVGAGSNNTQTAIHNSKLFEGLGADALLSITPYYNKTTQTGLVKHFSAIAKEVSIPIILYNVPSRTGINMEPKTILTLSKISNIVGIKEASGNLNQMAKIIKVAPKDFAVYSGEDSLTLPALTLGAKGVFSVTGNLFPHKMQQLCQYYFDGNLPAAQKEHYNLLEMFELLFCEVNPIPIKTAMNILHKNVGPLRLPLCAISRKNYQKIKKAIKKVDLS